MTFINKNGTPFCSVIMTRPPCLPEPPKIPIFGQVVILRPGLDWRVQARPEHDEHKSTLSSSDMKNGLDPTCDAKIEPTDILSNWVKAVGVFVVLVAV